MFAKLFDKFLMKNEQKIQHNWNPSSHMSTINFILANLNSVQRKKVQHRFGWYQFLIIFFHSASQYCIPFFKNIIYFLKYIKNIIVWSLGKVFHCLYFYSIHTKKTHTKPVEYNIHFFLFYLLYFRWEIHKKLLVD